MEVCDGKEVLKRFCCFPFLPHDLAPRGCSEDDDEEDDDGDDDDDDDDDDQESRAGPKTK